MSKKKKSGQAAAATVVTPEAAVMNTLSSEIVAKPKTDTILSKPNRQRGYFAAQASTVRKLLLGE